MILTAQRHQPHAPSRSAAEPVIRVEPLGVEIRVQPGETLIDAAWREGYEWPTLCFGQLQCTLCHVIVRDGAENLSAIGPEEAQAMHSLLGRGGKRDLSNCRLACCVQVHGPAVVEKDGVRRRGP